MINCLFKYYSLLCCTCISLSKSTFINPRIKKSSNLEFYVNCQILICNCHKFWLKEGMSLGKFGKITISW